MNIFELNDYKVILRSIINDRRNQYGLKFTFEKMARACGIQKTYLSKVLNGTGQLNADQLYSACEYLDLNAVQIEFILLIREEQLAQNLSRKEKLMSEINHIRKKQMKTEIKIGIPSLKLNNEMLWEFYNDFDLQLALVFLTIPKFLLQPSEIARYTGLSQAQLANILFKLEKWGLIRSKNGKFELISVNTHLSSDSPIINSYRITARLQAIEYLRKFKERNESNNYSISALFSSEASFQKKLRAKILDLVKETHHQVSKSKSEDVHLLNIDLLKMNIDPN